MVADATYDLSHDLADRGLAVAEKSVVACKRAVAGLYVAIGALGLFRAWAGSGCTTPSAGWFRWCWWTSRRSRWRSGSPSAARIT